MGNSLDNMVATEFARQRRVGYTTQICKIAKELDGTVLFGDKKMAKQAKIEYGCKTASVQENLRGLQGPFFWDSTAYISAHSNIIKDIAELEQRIRDEYEIRNQMLLDQRNTYKEDLMKVLKNPIINFIVKVFSVL